MSSSLAQLVVSVTSSGYGAAVLLFQAFELIQHFHRHLNLGPTSDPFSRTSGQHEITSLPTGLIRMLMQVLSIPATTARDLYTRLTPVIHLIDTGTRFSPDNIYAETGSNHRLAPKIVEAKLSVCSATACANTVLSDRIRTPGVRYTLNGPVPVLIVTKLCRGCGTRYGPTFSQNTARKAKPGEENDQDRTYYMLARFEKIPFVHLGVGMLVDTDVCTAFWALLTRNWTAFTAMEDFYARSFRHLGPFQQHFRLKPPTKLTSNTINHLFLIHRLLVHHQRSGTQLILDSIGAKGGRLHPRLHAAAELRNLIYIRDGLPHRDHVCLKCVRLRADGTLRYIVLRGVDGICIGYFCCAFLDCEEPLVNSHTDLWCATHIYKKLECHVPSCTTALIPGENWKSCTLAAHRDQEVLIRARIASTPAWELHRRPGASRSNTAPDVVPPIDSAANPSHGISFEDYRELYSELQQPPVGGAAHSDATRLAKKDKLQFSKDRWHNQQIMTCDCEIITARVGMKESESTSAVLDFIRDSVPTSLLDALLCWFDDSCHGTLSLNRAHLDGSLRWIKLRLTLLLVDRFHKQTKHKVDDEWCNIHANASTIPWLFVPLTGKPLYNSAVMESINAWLSKSFTVLRGMTAVMFNFVLDEVITMRNEWEVTKLEAAGFRPTHLKDLEASGFENWAAGATVPSPTDVEEELDEDQDAEGSEDEGQCST